MAELTTKFKDAIEFDPTIETVVLANYPIFDESYRPRLNELILDRYWNMEIGQETVSMFKLALKRRLNEQMPYFNEQYKLNALEVDPLQTVKFTTISKALTESETTGTQESTSGSTSNAAGKAYAYPQSQIDAAEGVYASEGNTSESVTEGTGTAQESSSGTGSTENESETTGSQGHVALLIDQYRAALTNVDELVLESLRDCFSLIWSNTDSATGSMKRGSYLGLWY